MQFCYSTCLRFTKMDKYTDGSFRYKIASFTGYELILHINILNISAFLCVCGNSCFTNSLLYHSPSPFQITLLPVKYCHSLSSSIYIVI